MQPTTRFLDCDCVRLSNGAIELLVAQSVGPRILALHLPGKANLLAELPGVVIDRPGDRPFRFWGGHRLWYAPEEKAITYLPDDQPVTITAVEGGIQMTPPAELGTGMQKTITVTLPDETATVIVDHTLTNGGPRPRLCAPWAITQLKPGGVAILPQNSALNDPDGLQPNRSLALWPYTDINSPYIQWGNRFVFVQATMQKQDSPLKIGWPNPAGWMAYSWGEMLFMKQAVYQPSDDYFDMGSSSQCYCRHDFIELETLGPRTLLEPGQSISHREIWRVLSSVQLTKTEDAVAALVGEWVY